MLVLRIPLVPFCRCYRLSLLFAILPSTTPLSLQPISILRTRIRAGALIHMHHTKANELPESNNRPQKPHLLPNPHHLTLQSPITRHRPPTRTTLRHRNRNRPTQRPYPRLRPRNSLQRRGLFPLQHQHHLGRAVHATQRRRRVSLQNCRSEESTSSI